MRHLKSTPLKLAACLAAAPVAVTIPAEAQDVYRVPISGTIELGIAPFLERSIRQANDLGAVAIVLDIETPGGRVDAAQRMVKAIVGSAIPVYALVNTHAWSAGALIALGADSIFMTPGSSIGAATPVSGAGEKAPEKIVSAMRAEFRALAERRGFDPDIAAAMVDEEIEIEGVVEAGKLLTLTASEAVDLGLAAREVNGMPALLVALGLDGAEIITTKINWAESLVRFLSNPLVAPMLLSIGMLGLIIEIKTPSFGLAGAAGLTALGAFFGSHLLVGLAGWEEIILLSVGLVALAFEVFIVPGFGLAGVIAVFSIGAGTFLALLGSLPTWPDVARAGGIMAITAAIVVGAVWAFWRHLPTAGRFRNIFLQESTAKELGYVAGDTHSDLIGAVGVAITDLRPAGTVTVNGERLDAVSEVGYVGKGAQIRVIRSEGYRHVVEPVEGLSTASVPNSEG